MYNNSSIKNIRWSKQSFQCHIVHEVTGRNNMETMVTFQPTSHTNKGKNRQGVGHGNVPLVISTSRSFPHS